MSDPVLDALLHARTERDRQEAIASLLSEHAYRLIDRILASRYQQSSLSPDLREDIRNEIIVRLVNRLSQAAEETGREGIENFQNYVAVVAYNTFDDFVRRAFPQRTRLKSRIRYALSTDPRLALWEQNGSLIGGLHAWRGSAAGRIHPSAVSTPATTRRDLPAAIVEVFTALQAPLLLDDLFELIMQHYDVGERETALADHDLPAAFRDPGQQLESLQYLRALWDEISALPLRQRIALLLHARDDEGESVTRFLPLSGVATIRQIGQVLEIRCEEFVELWKELPLEDTRIAVMLQLSRQQVINLRRSARDRLERRMGRKRSK